MIPLAAADAKKKNPKKTNTELDIDLDDKKWHEAEENDNCKDDRQATHGSHPANPMPSNPPCRPTLPPTLPLFAHTGYSILYSAFIFYVKDKAVKGKERRKEERMEGMGELEK